MLRFARIDKLFLALLVFIFCIPLWLVSERSVYTSVAEIWVCGLVCVWLVEYLRRRRQVPEVFCRAKPVLVIWLVWLVFTILQITPLPKDLVEWISPQSVWVDDLAFHEDPAAWVSISVNPHSTAAGVQKSVGFVLLFVAVLLLVTERARLRLVALVLVASGLLQALIGVISLPLGLADKGVVSASFENRNHLANYLTICIAMGIGLLLEQPEQQRARNFKEFVRRTLDWLLSGRANLRFYLLIMVSALIMTQSRMGNVAFFASLLIAAVVVLTLSKLTRSTIVLITSLVVLDIAVVGTIVGLERVAERLQHIERTNETRDEVARDTLVYWRDYLTTGSGLGTFYVTYPRYKQGDVKAFYRRTHNDYLQFAAETGIIGMVLVGSGGLLSFFVALRALRVRHDPWSRRIAFSVVMCLVALAIHSTVEFNLQIFANAATFMVILALAWIAAYLPREVQQSRRLHRVGMPTRLSMVVIIIGLMVFSVWAACFGIAERITYQNKVRLAQWGVMQDVNIDEVEKKIARQVFAVKLTPRSADAKIVLSRLMFWWIKASSAGNQTLAPGQVLQDVLYLLLAAAEDNPGLASIWTAIAHVRFFERRFDPMFETALRRSTQLGPWEPHVQRDIATLGLTAWDALTNTRQRDLVMRTIGRGLQLDPKTMLEAIERTGQMQLVCGRLNHPVLVPICAER